MRANLIQILRETLEPLAFIHALWLEGADALNRVDAYSDIDVWLDVDAEHIDEAFNMIRSSLLGFGSLELDYEPGHVHPKIRQRFFRLEGYSQFLLLSFWLSQQH